MAGQQEFDWRGILAPQGAYSALVTTGSRPAKVARHCAGFAYVAVPYDAEARIRADWRIDRSVRQSVLGARELARLHVHGVAAICPTVQRAEILHSATTHGLGIAPFDAEFWGAQSLPFLNAAGVIVVPDCQGWSRCPTVWRDVGIALRRNLPVHFYAEAA